MPTHQFDYCSTHFFALLHHRSTSNQYSCILHFFWLFEGLRYPGTFIPSLQTSWPYNIYNWIINYLSERIHRTLLNGVLSSPQTINASIVQWSVLGPIFNINSSELKPLSDKNYYFKYADDGYLIVPASNCLTIPLELQHHASWAASCNLKLNPTKTSEIVFSSNRAKEPAPNSGVRRVKEIKILGVIFDNRLTFSNHVQATISSCNQSLFALRTLKQHGLSEQCLRTVFKSTVISKLLYASPAYWGFLTAHNKNLIDSFLRRAIRFGYYSTADPDLVSLIEKSENNLFNSIFENPNHVLHSLLPDKKQTSYNLHSHGHNLTLPHKDDRNFINRMLYCDIYWISAHCGLFCNVLMITVY